MLALTMYTVEYIVSLADKYKMWKKTADLVLNSKLKSLTKHEDAEIYKHELQTVWTNYVITFSHFSML